MSFEQTGITKESKARRKIAVVASLLGVAGAVFLMAGVILLGFGDGGALSWVPSAVGSVFLAGGAWMGFLWMKGSSSTSMNRLSDL
jgi:hypothetical protein